MPASRIRRPAPPSGSAGRPRPGAGGRARRAQADLRGRRPPQDPVGPPLQQAPGDRDGAEDVLDLSRDPDPGPAADGPDRRDQLRVLDRRDTRRLGQTTCVGRTRTGPEGAALPPASSTTSLVSSGAPTMGWPPASRYPAAYRHPASPGRPLTPSRSARQAGRPMRQSRPGGATARRSGAQDGRRSERLAEVRLRRQIGRCVVEIRFGVGKEIAMSVSLNPSTWSRTPAAGSGTTRRCDLSVS